MDDVMGVVEPVRQFIQLIRPDPREDSREASRAAVSGLACSLGRVIDFSQTGMRLETSRRWRPGRSRTITLSAAPFSLRLRVTGVWSRRTGWFRHIAGVRFVGLTAADAETLGLLLARHVVRVELARAS
ncbi:MAG: PilZ domain-containing protein [Phycisphaeraceae bacterium]|nr:PilZ domain-containing protein [Phycisphaeraceae bacterium]